eukprot:gene2075-4052_t
MYESIPDPDSSVDLAGVVVPLSDIEQMSFFAPHERIIHCILVPPLLSVSFQKDEEDEDENVTRKKTSSLSAMLFFTVNIIVILYLAIGSLSHFKEYTGYPFSEPKHDIYIIISGIVVTFTLILLIGVLSFSYMANNGEDRIPFSSAILGTATSAIQDYFTALLSIFQFIFPMISTPQRQVLIMSFYKALILILFAFSYYWTSQVILAVISCTVSGVVTVWWHIPGRRLTVIGSLFRSMTFQLPSIALGAIIIGPLHVTWEILTILRNLFRRREGCSNSLQPVLSVIDAMLRSLEKSLSRFNRYGYVYVASSGENLSYASAKAMDLFGRRGWMMIVSDNLISNVLVFGAIGIALTSAALGYLMAFFMSFFLYVTDIEIDRDSVNIATIFVTTGLIMGVMVGTCLSSVLQSAVWSVLVHFADDPKALKEHHGCEHWDLLRIWDHMYPASLAWMRQRRMIN